MDAGQNVLALMMKKKRAEGSLDMPVVKKKKKKQKVEQPPPQPPKPPTPPPPTPPVQEGKLNVTVIEQNTPDQNEFFDAQCKAADEQLEKERLQKQKFGKKLKKVSGLMARLHASVQQIKSRYNELDLEELITKKPNKQKIAQANAFVKSQKVKKKKFNHSIDDKKKKQEDKKQKQELTKEQLEAKQKERLKNQMLKQLEKQRLQKLKEKQEMQKKKQKAKQIIEKYKDQKPLYVRYQLKQQEKDKKQQEKMEVFLMRRGERYKPVEFSEIGSHMKAHKEHLRDSSLVKEQEHVEKHHKLMQENLKLLQKIYRGKTYEMVQQQEEERRLLRLKAKAQREKIKKYESYVRQNFKPEVKQNEGNNEQNQMQKSNNSQVQQQNQDEQQNEDEVKKKEEQSQKFRKIKRYKFLQGKSCGQIIQTVKAPLSERLQRRLGDDYLQHAISLPKKRLSKESQRKLESNSIEILTPVKKPLIQIPIMPRPKNYSVRVSQTPNRKQLSNILQLLKSRDSQAQMKQKHLLRAVGDKDKFEYKAAGSIHDDIIHNIERKLSLLHQL